MGISYIHTVWYLKKADKYDLKLYRFSNCIYMKIQFV
jgi:hypothetical protein